MAKLVRRRSESMARFREHKFSGLKVAIVWEDEQYDFIQNVAKLHNVSFASAARLIVESVAKHFPEEKFEQQERDNGS